MHRLYHKNSVYTFADSFGSRVLWCVLEGVWKMPDKVNKNFVYSLTVDVKKETINS